MVQKIGVILIFGGICFVFVFMGYNTFGPTTSGYAARVNNTIISITEHNIVSNNMLNYYSQLFGDRLPLKSEQIRSMALEQMITQEATAQAVKAEGLLVAPAFLKDSIVTLPAFQKNGQFQRSYYDNYLESQRLSPSRFEKRMERDLSTDMARKFFETHLRPTSLELQKAWQIKNTQINIEFVKIDPDILLQTLDIPDRDLSVYLESEDHLKDLESTYNNNRADYTSEAEVKLQHILIRDESREGKTAQEAESSPAKAEVQGRGALEQIQELAERAKTEDFSKLATTYSQDPGSKNKGGDLGYVTRGQMVSEVEDVAFSLDVGQISQPIRTTFGYHLVKVLERKDPYTPSFEEIKSDLAQQALLEKKVEETLTQLKEALKGSDLVSVERLLKESGH